MGSEPPQAMGASSSLPLSEASNLTTEQDAQKPPVPQRD